MDSERIIELIKGVIPDAEVFVETEDHVHFSLTIISSSFTGVSPVKRQQTVYSALNPHILSGELHAVAMQTKTPEESK